jgi:hypothetical protein
MKVTGAERGPKCENAVRRVHLLDTSAADDGKVTQVKPSLVLVPSAAGWYSSLFCVWTVAWPSKKDGTQQRA